MIKAAILDDHPIVADGLQKLLREDFSISRVEQFKSGEGLQAI
jgi:DNA-binding NarL/FixJ family response regulator